MPLPSDGENDSDSEAPQPSRSPAPAARPAFRPRPTHVSKISQHAAAFADEQVDPKKLPQLDDLAARIPDSVRDTLDELFRGRFISVKRVPPAVLKDET